MRYVPSIITKAYDISPIWTRNIFSTGYGYIKTKKEKEKRFHQILDFLNISQYWSKEELERYQNKKLQILIKHCFENVPYYRKIFLENNIVLSQIQDKNDLKKIPLLTKNDIKNNFPALIAKQYSIDRMIPESTSGTTGKPLTVYWAKEDYSWSIAITHFIMKKSGYNFKKDWLAVFNGYKIIPSNNNSSVYWIKDYYNKKIHFSSYHLSMENVIEYFNYFTKNFIKYIIGYASLVGLFAKLLNEMNKKINLEAVILTSEPIYDWQIEDIKKAFNCRIINSYGLAERVVAGYSCGTNLNIHLFDEISISEFIENEFGQTEIVSTSLVNFGMPLLRYKVGDITKKYNADCLCGSNHTIIYPVETKKEDFIITPENKYISASLLTFPFKQPEGIIEAQVIQNKVDSIVVNLVTTEQYSNFSEDNIKKELISILTDKFEIKFNYLKKIPKTSNGKHRFVISNLNNLVR